MDSSTPETKTSSSPPDTRERLNRGFSGVEQALVADPDIKISEVRTEHRRRIIHVTAPGNTPLRIEVQPG